LNSADFQKCGLVNFGNATLWMAVFADMGASLLVVGNGLRLLQVTGSEKEKAA
jgi:Cd2+/Zn2+-exporting ATPase